MKHRYGKIGPDKNRHLDARLSFHGSYPRLDITNLSQWCPPAFDQGKEGSCVSFAVKSGMLFNYRKDGDLITDLSVRMLYKKCCELMGLDIHTDPGAYTRIAIRAASKFGVCLEKLCPYTPGDFDREITQDCLLDAAKRKILLPFRIENSFDLTCCLTAGWPVITGMPVFESMETDEVAETGEIPMPKAWERILGWHDVYIHSHNDHIGKYTGRNSWGQKWGIKGDFTLPYDFIEKFVVPEGSGDMWAILRELEPQNE